MGRYFSDDALSLLSPLVGLARSLENESVADKDVTALLFSAVRALGDGVFTPSSREETAGKLSEAKRKIVPSCFVCAHPCGHNDDYPIEKISDLDNASSKEIIDLLGEIISALSISSEKKYELTVKSLIYISSDFGDGYMKSLIDFLRSCL